MTPSHLRCPNLDMPHSFLSRRGGVSSGLYASLNCGPGSDDDPSNVAENRRIAASEISGRRDTPLLTCYQIHSADTVVATANWGEDRPKADAIVSNRRGLILGILTADCTPVLFADHNAGVIGAAHAGWKGALAGVIENTIAAMEKLGARRNQITAAIGPTIQQQSYEVDTDFRAIFTKENKAFSTFFTPGAYLAHLQFDLPGFVCARLNESGVAHIWDAEIDTYSSPNHFSYRRTTHNREADYGRQLAAILLP